MLSCGVCGLKTRSRATTISSCEEVDDREDDVQARRLLAAHTLMTDSRTMDAGGEHDVAGRRERGVPDEAADVVWHEERRDRR